ncbi:MAG: hypothetical protein AB9873_17820 [Syntrophobacteraceae bacterium]
MPDYQINEQFVSLENLGGGKSDRMSAAVELFNVEFQRVLDNCLDPNTKATEKREVTLKVKIKPDEDRESCLVEIHATSKLAAIRPYPTNIFLGKDGDRAVAVEHDPKQRNIFHEIEKEKQKRNTDKVLPMERKAGDE